MDGKIKVDHACIYASRCLRGPELRYSTYDRELLAIVFAKDQFRPFLYGRKFKVITDHEPLNHFHNTKKPDLRFNRLKSDLCSYEFEIEYRPSQGNCNADALSQNPIILKGEENPERPRVNLYELATKQEQEDNYKEHDPPKIRYVTISMKRDRIQANIPHPGTNERLTSGSEDSGNPRDRKLLNLDSSIDSDNPDDSDTEKQHVEGEKRKKLSYKKKAAKKTGIKYPIFERISETGLPSDEPILSQAETDKDLAYLHKSANMRTAIQGVSSPMENIVLPAPRLPFQHPALIQKPRFGESPTDTASDSESNLDDIAEQPDTARPKSPVAKIADSNDCPHYCGHYRTRNEKLDIGNKNFSRYETPTTGSFYVKRHDP